MKNRMKKLVAIAATAAMVGSLPVSAVTTYAADDDITIGVSIWSSTDVLGSQCKKIIDKAAAALDVNVMYVDQGHVSEQVTASVEQLCAAGCDGTMLRVPRPACGWHTLRTGHNSACSDSLPRRHCPTGRT